MNFTPRSATARRGVQRLPLAPMIDVIFLLLIFFMTTTTLATPEAELASGLQAQREGAAVDLAPQVLEVTTIAGQTAYRIGERAFTERASLRAVLESLPKDAGVFVKVYPSVRVADVAEAIQTCRDAGFQRVTYVPAN